MPSETKVITSLKCIHITHSHIIVSRESLVDLTVELNDRVRAIKLGLTRRPAFLPDFESPDFLSNVPFFNHFARLTHGFVKTALTWERSIAVKKKHLTSVVDINGILLQALCTYYNMMS